MTGLWQKVIDHAGGRCECRGACGRKHRDDPAGRCTRENTETAPLHAVPREPVTTRAAASLPAEDMHALCGPCHETTARKQAAERASALRAEADTDALF
jgi:hypothetical protein